MRGKLVANDFSVAAVKPTPSCPLLIAGLNNTLLGLPLAMGIALLAEPLVYLFAGPRYVPESVWTLQVLIWFLPFSFVRARFFGLGRDLRLAIADELPRVE